MLYTILMVSLSSAWSLSAQSMYNPLSGTKHSRQYSFKSLNVISMISIIFWYAINYVWFGWFAENKDKKHTHTHTYTHTAVILVLFDFMKFTKSLNFSIECWTLRRESRKMILSTADRLFSSFLHRMKNNLCTHQNRSIWMRRMIWTKFQTMDYVCIKVLRHTSIFHLTFEYVNKQILKSFATGTHIHSHVMTEQHIQFSESTTYIEHHRSHCNSLTVYFKQRTYVCSVGVFYVDRIQKGYRKNIRTNVILRW